MVSIKPGIYQHYKGKRYQVLSTGLHSETLEKMVIYQALYNSKKFGKNAIWIRPLKMFKEKITINGKKIPRFTFIKSIK
ncbi:MAG TPA: DUF1653 domain-containing protein [Candidatus Paceibacterota bacterium]|jgi:hypothetical protein|nr:DUF1653 domain-containing protein [Candidatus Paceibacterota bacterium]HRZ29496.1 DUF1653 domain-containing protein [Candidatus Paceibacterota bacterium]